MGEKPELKDELAALGQLIFAAGSWGGSQVTGDSPEIATAIVMAMLGNYLELRLGRNPTDEELGEVFNTDKTGSK